MVLQSLGGLADVVDRVGNRQRAELPDESQEVDARDVLHRQVRDIGPSRSAWKTVTMFGWLSRAAAFTSR